MKLSCSKELLRPGGMHVPAEALSVFLSRQWCS